MTNNINDELRELFLSECEKLLNGFEQIITQSDRENRLTDTAELFRVLHTLKGSSAMMSYAPLTDISHDFENILSQIKKNETLLTGKSLQEFVDVSLDFSGYFMNELHGIAAGRMPVENTKLKDRLDRLTNILFENRTEEKSEKSQIVPANVQSEDGNDIHALIKLKNCSMPHIRAAVVTKSVSALCSTIKTVPENIDKVVGIDDDILKNGFEIRFQPGNDFSDEDVVNGVMSQAFVTSCEIVTKSLNGARDSGNQALTPSQNTMVSQQTLNELLGRIDDILTQESTLEIQLGDTATRSKGISSALFELKYSLRQVSMLAASLGNSKLDDVFIRMQKTIRSMASELGKDIRVQFSGNEIEVDKSIIELLSDALIHIVRNAVDHGIEFPSERMAKGKGASGVITLSALKENDYLIVTLTDDGHGMNTDVILNKADEMGLLVKPKQEYTQAQVWQLLFTSGFSTKSEITQHSGRGVGLDTVIRRINQVGGKVLVKSQENVGTEFELRIPVTLKVIDGIRVICDSACEAIIPATMVKFVFDCKKPDFRKSGNGIVHYGDRDYRYLSLPGESEASQKSGGYILLMCDGEYYIHVQSIKMMESYYVKPIPDYISGRIGENAVFSGCVLCEESRILCVLDIEKVIGAANSTHSKRGIDK